jgi:hypothetical protein
MVNSREMIILDYLYDHREEENYHGKMFEKLKGEMAYSTYCKNLKYLVEKRKVERIQEGKNVKYEIILNPDRSYTKKIDIELNQMVLNHNLYVKSKIDEDTLHDQIFRHLDIKMGVIDNKDLTDNLHLSDRNEKLLALLTKAIIRDIFIMNPDNWSLMNEDKDFNLEFSFRCNLGKTKGISNLIGKLREEYKGIGRIPNNRVEFAFKQYREKMDIEEYQLLNQKNDKHYYDIAIGQSVQRVNRIEDYKRLEDTSSSNYYNGELKLINEKEWRIVERKQNKTFKTIN